MFHSLVGKHPARDFASRNPFFESNYASLPHILDEIQVYLWKGYGIGYISSFRMVMD
jgi:hypothetical protein